MESTMALGCIHVSSLTPSRFLSVFLYSSQHPLVSSLVSRRNSVEISWFGPQISHRSAKSAKYRGILRVYAIRVYLENTWYVPGFLDFASDFAPDQLSVLRRQTQGNSSLLPDRMEHHTPSDFPGNFRKRKVLGTLSFPFWFPETCMGTGQGGGGRRWRHRHARRDGRRRRRGGHVGAARLEPLAWRPSLAMYVCM